MTIIIYSRLHELQVQSKQILVGGFYRPPNSGAEYFNLVVESFDRAHNTNIADLIILGDFIYNMMTNDNNKIRDTCTMLHYNLSQVIKDATHFTENSSSLIDLGPGLQCLLKVKEDLS